MRAGLFLLLLPGCLAAPADAVDAGAQSDGGASGGDAVAVRCVPGSTLDLAYVSRISVMRASATLLTLAGTAVFLNPGEDTILVPQVTAAAAGGDPDVLATAGIDGGDAGMVLAPGEAKGALGETASPLVQAQFAEAWNDTMSPSLVESFSLSGDTPDSAVLGDLEVPIQVQAGDYSFAIFVTLVNDDANQVGTPLEAARASATCE